MSPFTELSARFGARMGYAGAEPHAAGRAGRAKAQPTRFGVGVATAAILMFALSLRSGAAGLQPLVGLLLAPLLLAFARGLTPKRLRWKLSVAIGRPGMGITVGSTTTFPVLVTNLGARRLPTLRVDISGDGLVIAPLTVRGLAPGERRHVDLTVHAARHGVHTGLQMVVTDADPFGLVQTVRSYPLAEGRLDIAATPATLPLAAPPLGPGRGDDDESMPSGRAALQGFQPRGTRDFRPGDEQRSVHWRATARTGRLTVREWDPPVASGVALVVQLAPDSAAPVLPERPAGSGAEADERLLEVAASVGLAALRAGRRVSLVQARVRPAPGGATAGAGVAEVAEVDVRPALDSSTLLRGLAAVESVRTGLVPLADAAVDAAGRGGTVVLVLGIGWGHWEPGELVEVARRVRADGAALQVLYGRTPDGPLPMGAAAAFAALAAQAPLRDAATLRALSPSSPWPAPRRALVPTWGVPA